MFKHLFRPMVDAELCLEAGLLLSDNTVRLNYKDQVWLRLRTLEGTDVQCVCVCVCVYVCVCGPCYPKSEFVSKFWYLRFCNRKYQISLMSVRFELPWSLRTAKPGTPFVLISNSCEDVPPGVYCCEDVPTGVYCCGSCIQTNFVFCL